MARGGRGGAQSGGKRGNAGVPGQRPRKQGGGAGDTLPTAMPGAANAPAGMTGAPGAGGSSIFGGALGGVQRPEPRARRASRGGGPRNRDDRRAAQRIAAIYDFRYVRPDLRWIGLTTVVSTALIVLAWVLVRL